MVTFMYVKAFHSLNRNSIVCIVETSHVPESAENRVNIRIRCINICFHNGMTFVWLYEGVHVNASSSKLPILLLIKWKRKRRKIHIANEELNVINICKRFGNASHHIPKVERHQRYMKPILFQKAAQDLSHEVSLPLSLRSFRLSYCQTNK